MTLMPCSSTGIASALLLDWTKKQMKALPSISMVLWPCAVKCAAFPQQLEMVRLESLGWVVMNNYRKLWFTFLSTPILQNPQTQICSLSPSLRRGPLGLCTELSCFGAYGNKFYATPFWKIDWHCVSLQVLNCPNGGSLFVMMESFYEGQPAMGWAKQTATSCRTQTSLFWLPVWIICRTIRQEHQLHPYHAALLHCYTNSIPRALPHHCLCAQMLLLKSHQRRQLPRSPVWRVWL